MPRSSCLKLVPGGIYFFVRNGPLLGTTPHPRTRSQTLIEGERAVGWDKPTNNRPVAESSYCWHWLTADPVLPNKSCSMRSNHATRAALQKVLWGRTRRAMSIRACAFPVGGTAEWFVGARRTNRNSQGRWQQHVFAPAPAIGAGMRRSMSVLPPFPPGPRAGFDDDDQVCTRTKINMSRTGKHVRQYMPLHEYHGGQCMELPSASFARPPVNQSSQCETNILGILNRVLARNKGRCSSSRSRFWNNMLQSSWTPCSISRFVHARAR